MDMDLNRQIANRQRMRDREFYREDKAWFERRQAELDEQSRILQAGITLVNQRLAALEAALGLETPDNA